MSRCTAMLCGHHHHIAPVVERCAFFLAQAGKQSQARLLLQKGCEFCPTSDDIWLEASRMQSNPDSAKAMLARGVAALPNSIKLWLQVRLVCASAWLLGSAWATVLLCVLASVSVSTAHLNPCLRLDKHVLRRLPGWRRMTRQRRGCCGGRWSGCPTACGCGRPRWSWPTRTTPASSWCAAACPAPTFSDAQPHLSLAYCGFCCGQNHTRRC